MKVNKIRIVVEPIKDFGKRVDKDLKMALKSKRGSNTLTISVGALDDISKVLTPERIRLIHAIREKHPASLSELARLLGRNRRAIAMDINVLKTFSIVNVEETRDNGRIVAEPHTPKVLEISV